MISGSTGEPDRNLESHFIVFIFKDHFTLCMSVHDMCVLLCPCKSEEGFGSPGTVDMDIVDLHMDPGTKPASSARTSVLNC